MEIKPIELHEAIRLSRLRLHMSQTELAEKAGISRNYVSQIERGYLDRVSLGVLENLCDALGLDMKVFAEPKEQS